MGGAVPQTAPFIILSSVLNLFFFRGIGKKKNFSICQEFDFHVYCGDQMQRQNSFETSCWLWNFSVSRTTSQQFCSLLKIDPFYLVHQLYFFTSKTSRMTVLSVTFHSVWNHSQQLSFFNRKEFEYLYRILAISETLLGFSVCLSYKQSYILSFILPIFCQHQSWYTLSDLKDKEFSMTRTNKLLNKRMRNDKHYSS